MKKFLLLMLTLVCMFSLVACMGDGTTSESKKESQSKKESVSVSQSIKDSEPTSIPTSEPTSNPTSEPTSTPTSEPTSEPASTPQDAKFTITFEVASGVAPTSIEVKEGDVVTLPTTIDGAEFQLKHWVIKGTDTVFVDGEYTLDSDVTLVAVFFTETGIY